MSTNFDGYDPLAPWPMPALGVRWAEVPAAAPHVPTEADIVIRQSTITNMMLSPAREGYRGSEGFRFFPSEPLLFGTVVHYMAQEFIEGKSELQIIHDDNVRVLIEKGLESYDEKWELDEIANLDQQYKFTQEARNAFLSWRESFWEHEGKLLENLLVEQELVYPLGIIPENDKKVYVKGTPDWVANDNGRIILYDFKTSSRAWSTTKADTSIQGGIYRYLLECYFGRIKEELPVRFIVYDRSKKEWSRIDTYRNREVMDSSLRIAWQYARMIAFDTFPCTPYSCGTRGDWSRGWWSSPKYCPAWKACSMKNLADGVVEKEIEPVYHW